MTTFQIEIKTLSATSPGSGYGRTGVLDRDITHNNFGIPYIGARRLKGLLKESLCEVHEVLSAFPDWSKNNLLLPIEVFGSPGQREPAKFKLGDAQIAEEKALNEWLNYISTVGGKPFFHPEAVLEYFTEYRSQTKMNRLTGGPMENSLRSSRLLRPLLTFSAVGEISSPDTEWNKRAVFALYLACRNLRRAGIARNRGTGHIDVTLHSYDDICFPTLDDLPKMLNKVEFNS